MDVLFKKDLFEAIKAKGESLTYRTLLKYEKLGLVPRPKSKTRVYAPEDVEIFVEAIRQRKFKIKTQREQKKPKESVAG